MAILIHQIPVINFLFSSSRTIPVPISLNNRIANSPSLSTGWHHFVAVNDHDTALYLYMDGKLVDTDTISHGSYTIDISGYNLYAGFGSDSYFANCILDQIRIYNYT